MPKFVLAILLVLPLAGPGFAAELSTPSQEEVLSPIPGLPQAVTKKRQEIFSAAIRGDLRKLARLATRHRFNFGFDEHGTFLHYLEEGEREPGPENDRPLYLLRKLLNGPWEKHRESNSVTYTWFEFDPKTLPPDRFYYGYYVTITQDGEWTDFGLSD